jgi:hypothetical protein
MKRREEKNKREMMRGCERRDERQGTIKFYKVE